MATADKQLDRLSQQLSRQTLGPVDTILDDTVSRLAAAYTSLTSSLRQLTQDRPLIAILLSCQAGYLVARLGRRYARR